MFRSLVTGSALLAVAAIGCGEQGEGSAADPVERAPVPEGPFKPAGLEDTIGVLAAEIDRTDAAELRLGVALGSGALWDPVNAGAERALSELGVQGSVTASSEAEQVDFVERQREEASNGIGVAPLTSSLDDEVERAREDGIPVVTIDNDLPERELFVGLGQYEVGQRLGDFVVQATGLREGRVIILGSDDEADSPVAYQRSQGAKSVMIETGLDVVIRNTSTEAQDVEMLTQDLLGTPRPLAVLGVLETSYRVSLAAEAAERSLAADAGDEADPTGLMRLRNVAFVGYGLEPATVEALRAEILRVTFAERRHYMGYVVPYVLAGFTLLGIERTKYILTPHVLEDGTFDVGVDLIRPGDLDAYFEFQELLPR